MSSVVIAACARLLTGRWSARLVVVVGVAVGLVLIAFAGTARVDQAATADLPSSAQSTTVARLAKQLPSGQVDPVLIVLSRPGATLTAGEIASISTPRPALDRVALGGRASPVQVSANRRVALIAVPLRADLSQDATSRVVTKIRRLARQGLPAGVKAQVTGGPAFATDVGAAFGGANTTLLLATAGIVAALLLITYRSPVLWIVPLAVVGIADQANAALLSIVSRHTSFSFDPATSGIVEVLVFGAGTDYALLLIARYREELRAHPDRREAMRVALRAAAPPIAASAGTVILALLTLLFASFGSNRDVGIAGAVGIFVALVFALSVLPAALVSLPRGVFWPLVPHADEQTGHRGGKEGARAGRTWRRIGEATARRPWPVIVVSVLLLGALATGLASTSLGLSQADSLRTKAESVDGLKTLSSGFPAGSAEPVTLITTPAATERVLAAVKRVPGVSSATAAGRTSRLSEIDVTITAAPDTPASYDTVRALRTAAAGVPGARAAVGGSVAIDLDTRDAAVHDLRLIPLLVLGVVLVVLLLLLRAVVASLILVASVVLTFGAAIGASSLLFAHVLHYPGLADQIPLYAFLFLVALGVDYNIFLVTRAQEEAATLGTRRGIIEALAVTGGVITSAGILLAAVFAVLGVLPVTLLTELGIIVGIGVLLDTLVVRTVLVPAVVHVLDARFWAPGRLSRVREPGSREPGSREPGALSRPG